jgi:hypothetical protein
VLLLEPSVRASWLSRLMCLNSFFSHRSNFFFNTLSRHTLKDWLSISIELLTATDNIGRPNVRSRPSSHVKTVGSCFSDGR